MDSKGWAEKIYEREMTTQRFNEAYELWPEYNTNADHTVSAADYILARLDYSGMPEDMDEDVTNLLFEMVHDGLT